MDPSEKYEPVEPNYYNYDALKYLDKNIDYYLNNTRPNKINICGFTVVNDSQSPFLKFLLVKNCSDEILIFPTMPVFKDVNSLTIASYSEMYLFNLLLLENNETYLENLEYNGCYIYENEVYIFYDLTNCALQVEDIYRENNIWFSLIDEIVNVRHVCNLLIDRNVSIFFNNNEQYCFLTDKQNQKYTIPIIGYVGKNENMLNFTYIFGVSTKDKSAILGPYYYFTDYQNAIKQGGWSEYGSPETRYGVLLTDNDNGRYIKGGIVRFALFLDKIKIINNYPNDDIDISSTKYERLNDESIDSNYDRLTMRISDHDGTWTNEYDSVYLGKVELDNGTFIKDIPIIVVKKYTQQYPLSYHYINKKCINTTFDENDNYIIA